MYTLSGGNRLQDICYNDVFEDSCTESFIGILKLWNFNKTLFQSDVSTDDDVAAACTSSAFFDSSLVDHNSLFGEYRTTDNNTKAQARSINLQYLVKGDISEDISLEWEKDVATFVENFNSQEIKAYIFNRQMLVEQQEYIILNQLLLMAITSAVLGGFMAMNIGDPWSRLNRRTMFATADLGLIVFR